MALLLGISQIDPQQKIGGKAAGLAQVFRLGFRIPESRILPCQVFDLWLKENDLEGWRSSMMSEISLGVSPARLGEIQRTWETSGGKTAISEELVAEIVQAFPGVKTLAIRSSADCEDGLDLSFAGQFHSEIGIPAKAADVERALKACFKAALNPAIFLYAREFGISLARLSLALLIQPALEPRCAGVAFSHDPLHGRSDVVVEAISGRADRLVQGQAIGQAFRLGSRGERPEGKSLLSESELAAIESLLQALQKAFGYPVDLEWAISGEELTVLQVRPITAIEPRSHSGIRWSRELTAERYPLPLSPLGWTNIKAVFDQGVRNFSQFMGIPLAANEELATCQQGWVVANPEVFDFRDRLKIRLAWRDALPVFWNTFRTLMRAKYPWRETQRLIQFVQNPRSAWTKLGDHLNIPVFSLASGTVRAFLRRTAGKVQKEWPGILQRFQSEVAEVQALVELESDPKRLLLLGDRLRKAMIAYINPDLVIFAVKEIAALMLAEVATLANISRPKEIPALLGLHLPRNVTLSLHQRLLALGALLNKSAIPGGDPEIGTNQEVELFFRENGHLSASWDILHPTWGEAREKILELARKTAAAAPADRKGVVSEASKARIQEFWDCLGKEPMARAFAEEMVVWLRTFMEIDEEHHFHTGRIIPPTRCLVLRLGLVLQSRGIIQHPEEVFWLTDPEVRTLLASPESCSRLPLIRLRQIAYQRALHSGPPRTRPANGTSGNKPLNEWEGLAVSEGVGTGRICRVGTMEDLVRVTDGAILLVRSPEPLFTMVFGRVAGIVSESGALLSHGAVTAREFSLPGVFGVRRAWDTLNDGDLVCVDGNRGSVILLERAPQI